MPEQPNKYLEPSIINRKSEISHKELQEKERVNANDGDNFETDFLISPGDVYPNRKIKLQDAEITDETRRQFDVQQTPRGILKEQQRHR